LDLLEHHVLFIGLMWL